MWISGRRAERPDRQIYREMRRRSLKSSHGRAIPIGMIAVVLLVVLIAGWFFLHK